MKVAVFSTKPYDRQFLDAANSSATPHQLKYFEPRLDETTVSLARGHEAVCAFVNDQLSAPVLEQLASLGIRVVALRSAGFNHVDLQAARQVGITVVRVPAYSPAAVAEHAVGLMMALNRKYHRAHNRVREGNFSLVGLVGFDMKGKTVGIIGTGKIGEAVVPILQGFGCRLVAYDVHPNPVLTAQKIPYLSLEELYAQSDIITLHCPLVEATRHLINPNSIAQMKDGVMLINTSRGAIIDTAAVIEGLKTGKIGALGLDVYEEEDNLFFQDLSNTVIQDDTFSRLITFPNVLVTGHQAFFTENALANIAETTLTNLTQLETTGECANRVDAT